MDEAGLDYGNRARLKNAAAALDMVLLTGLGVEPEDITVRQMRRELPVIGTREYLHPRQG